MTHPAVRGRRRHPERGMTLIEILVTLAVLGILANIIIPMVIFQVQKAQAQRIVTDFLYFRQALFDYYTDTGEYPRDRRWGVAPPELDDYLEGRLQWQQPGLGVWYDWENWVNRRGVPRRPGTGVARGFSVRVANRRHRMKTLIPLVYPDERLVMRGRKVIFVLEPARR